MKAIELPKLHKLYELLYQLTWSPRQFVPIGDEGEEAMPKEKRTILLVSKNKTDRLPWREYLETDDEIDWSFIEEESPAKAATSCLRLRPDCLLVTGTPSGINDVLAALQESLDQIPVIAITDPGTDSGAIETPLNKAIGREVGECLNREAVSSGVLRRTVSRAIEMTRMQCLIEQQVRQIEELSTRLETERRQMLERERQAREMAEAVNRDKDEFIAIVSHELRAPLNAILGWARILKIGKYNAKTFEHAVDVVERSARTQQRLIEDLLDTARVIRGKLRLETKPVDLARVIEASADSVHPAAEAKGIDLKLKIKGKNNVITGDEDRLQQVVWNLLSNAVKFTPEGGQVEVQLERADPYLQIIVKDTGKGISREFLPYIFDRFQQADLASRRRHSGLGLGLALVRHLVELHGGTVEADSAGEGRGATFRIRLPLPALRQRVDERKQSSWEKSVPVSTCSLDGIRALVVDDDPDARDLVATLLRQFGAQVTTASCASEAFDCVKTSEPSARPEILVSDIGMPEEDGYSLIESVRRLSKEEGGSIPAIALTAYGRASDRIRALSAGFQTHMPKPVEPAELVMVIYSLIRNQERGKS
jgi:signal transduction histidine kinase/ActR/RegA family two-component response regulator